MSSISLSSANNYRKLTQFLNPEAQTRDEPAAHQPIISVKSSVKLPAIDPETAKINNRRNAWHFLTLGIPALIETLSLFFSGITHRVTEGLPLRVRFKAQHLPASNAGELFKFQKYNKFSHKPLKRTEFEKILQVINRLINKAEDARTAGDAEALKKAQDDLKPLQSILEKTRDPKVTRKDFDENDWKVVDAITYELACDFFSSLTSMFNSDWIVQSGLQKVMKERFNLDYNESVVAESLSLAVAYIEGLEGKKLQLPVMDPVLGKYRSVEYTIKKSTLGDALPCYILESDDPSVDPWFIFRGTQSHTNISQSGKEYRAGSMESILADSIDPDCISRNVINKSLVKRPIVFENGHYVQKESLSDIFRKWKEEGKMVNLAGHSLGGTIVNALCVEFFEQIKTAYSFSAAGVSYETAVRWDEEIKKDPESAAARLINFDYEGDIVPAGGKMLIGTHLAVESLREWSTNGLHDSHVRSRLNDNFQIYKVDVKAENKKFARGFCERIRIITGMCFRILLWCFSRKFLPDWWINRRVYRKYAAIERSLRADERQRVLTT